MEGSAILRLRRCHISGFKALRDVSFVVRDDLLILIGNNGAGKSSAIQALAFLKDFFNGSPELFFDSRGWSKRDIRSQVASPGNTLRFDLLFEMPDGRRVLWQISWGLASGLNLREMVWIMDGVGSNPHRVLSYVDNGVRSDVDAAVAMRGLALKGSMLSIIEVERSSPIHGILKAVSKWARGIVSLELLSPRSMREGTRGRVSDIGPRGEHLASFLAGLSASKKASIVDRLSLFYPLDSIDTTRKRAGWVDLRIAETFGIGAIGIPHVSDGFLRLLALCALPEFGDAASLILLDEIEDGIEPHILPDLIQRIIADAPGQFIITSHSPLLVNFFDPRDIALIGRKSDGSAMTASLDRLPSIQMGLEYFGSGEIWINTGDDLLARELEEAAETMDMTAAHRFASPSVRAFMSMNDATGT